MNNLIRGKYAHFIIILTLSSAYTGVVNSEGLLSIIYSELSNEPDSIERIVNMGNAVAVNTEISIGMDRTKNHRREDISGKLNAGRVIFKSRCSLCHGDQGHGDGLMRKVITDPPPSDLTESTIDMLDVMTIIVNGGGPIDRSPQMPPWGDEFDEEQLESLINYLFTLRKTES